MQIIGNGGHAKVVRGCVMSRGQWFVAVGDNANRKNEVALQDTGYAAVAIHKSAIIDVRVDIGDGTVIMAGAVVQAGARIGNHVIINTGATVDHDCVIGDYAHIAPGAHLCGGVHVGEGALVGVGVGIEPGVRIPAWSVVKREAYTICPMK